MRRIFRLVPFVLVLLVPTASATSPIIRLVEIVADPLHDWNQDGKVTGSDEYVELVNQASVDIDLLGWNVLLNDTSPTTLELSGVLEANGRRLFLNPPGELNNNGHVAIRSPDGMIVDEVRFGSWSLATAPTADATNELDEALAFVDGRWRQQHATPDLPNEGPRWELAATWAIAPADGWWSPSATGQVSARAIHATVPIPTLELRHETGNASTVIAAPRNGEPVIVEPTDGAFVWRVPGQSWNITVAKVRVDATAPVVSVANETVWLPPGSPWIPAVVETGSGVDEFQWRKNATSESDWARNVTITMDWPKEVPTDIQVRARDRVGNIGPWTNVTVGLDDSAPAVAGLRMAQPSVPEWDPATGSGAPVTGWDVRRVHASPKDWSLPTEERTLRDEFDFGRTALAYEVRARDAAGNVGDAARIDVDHPGLHPQVLGIRITKPWWGSGTQEIRIDFDRRMMTDSPPLIELAGKILDQGRWLANASTFYASLASVDDFPEGLVRIQVVNASAVGGAALEYVAARSFTVDRSDPVFSFPESGWIRLANVTVRAVDASPIVVTWKRWPHGQQEPTAWNTTTGEESSIDLQQGAWTVKASAKDAAGNTATARREYKVDRVAPTWNTTPIAHMGRIFIEITDAQSGVQWDAITSTLPAEWTMRSDPSRHRVIVEADKGALDGVGALNVSDHAGNAVNIQIILTVPSGKANPSAEGGDDAASRLSQRLHAETNLAAEPDGSRSGALWTAGLLASTAASIPIVRSARKRRKQRPSFARRLRQARKRRSAT